MRINPIITNNQSAPRKTQSDTSSPSFTAWKFKTSKVILLMRACNPEENTLKVSSTVNKIATKLDELTKGYNLTIHHKNKGSYEFEELSLTIRKSVPPKNDLSGTLTDMVRPFAGDSIPYAKLDDPDLDKLILKKVDEIKISVDKDKRKTFLDGIF